MDSIASDPNKGQGCTTSLTKLIIQVRACAKESIQSTEDSLRKIIEEACAEENARFGSERVTFEMFKDEFLTPAPQNPEIPICGAAYTVLKDINSEDPRVVETGNCNFGAAVRAGIPAIALGTGGSHGGIHSLQEYFETTDMHKGPQSIMLIALMMAGVKNNFAPLA